MNESVYIFVDGRQRNARNDVANVLKDFLGSRIVVQGKDGLKDQITLVCSRESSPPAQLLEILELVFSGHPVNQSGAYSALQE